jgi:hypothetical protein
VDVLGDLDELNHLISVHVAIDGRALNEILWADK